MSARPVVLLGDAVAERYRAAVAELPLSARLADRAAGAVVVVAGGEWVDAALGASAAGAAALIVADPDVPHADDVRRLEQVDVPIIVERPLLRPDLAADAVRGRGEEIPRVITVDGAAGASRRSVVVRDAIGWARVLGGTGLDVRSAAAGLALLETSEGVAATLCIAASSRGEGWIRVRTLGEVRTEVEVTGHQGRLATASRAGLLVAPALYGSSERLALRRAIGAAESAEHPADLAELLVDSQLAQECDRALRA